MTGQAFDPAVIEGLSVRGLIDARARETPDAIFLIDPVTGEEISYAGLQQDCSAFASQLADRDFAPGDAIGYAMGNGADVALVILGCLYGGYLTTAINLVSGPSTLAHVLQHSGVRAVFVEDATRDLISEALIENGGIADLITFDDSWLDALDAPTGRLGPESDGLLMYTSGTTGVPKGVLHTHASLLAGGANAALAHQLTPDDRTLCVLPLYHINGFCVSLIGALVSGGSLVLPAKFSVGAFWDQMRRHGCTWFSVVPTQISYLLHEAETNGFDPAGLEALRFGRSASAPLSPDVQKAFEDRFGIPIIETMGLTETAAQILSNPIDGVRKIGSPGIAFGNQVAIGDADQAELPHGEEGEVLVRGANLMHGYKDNPDATTDALTADGWLRTGDLGRMDEDGYVFITGRLKELIIKGGENIAPREVDEALYSHPDVIEAAAFARPCPQYGQRVEAGVMVREGSDLTAEMLIALCHEKIGAFKSPDKVHFLPELPKGPSGKIQRLQLGEMTG